MLNQKIQTEEEQGARKAAFANIFNLPVIQDRLKQIYALQEGEITRKILLKDEGERVKPYCCRSADWVNYLPFHKTPTVLAFQPKEGQLEPETEKIDDSDYAHRY